MLPGGKMIREARLRAGMTQLELAERMGTSQPVIARWEKGHRSPSVEALVRAVRACGLDISMSIVAPDPEHELLISQNLAISPESRLHKMVSSRRGINELVEAVKVGNA